MIRENPVIVYLALAFVLMMPLLPGGYYLALDMRFGPSSFDDFQFGDLFSSGPTPYGAYIPLKLVLAFLSDFVPIDFLEKMMLFILLFASGVSMHYALPKELGRARYFAGFLYVLNPFVFVRFLAGNWFLLLSYSLWPIAIKLFNDFMALPKKRDNLVKSALVTSAAAISSHGLFILLICYLVSFIARFAGTKEKKTLIWRTTLLAGAVVLMNLFWTVPTLLVFDSYYEPGSAAGNLADFGAKGNELPLGLAVASLHGFWRGGFQLTKDVFELWYVPLAAILALVILGALSLFKSDRRELAVLAGIFIIGFLISLGPESPVSWIFTFLGEDVPLYFFFRDSHKFVGMLALVYSVLGAYGVNLITGRFKGIGKNAALLVLLALPFLYNFGFFGFLGQIGPTTYPSEWYEADMVMQNDSTPGNLIVLPPHLYTYYWWVNSSQKSLGNPASVFFSRPVITGRVLESRSVYSDMKDPKGDYLRFLFNNREYVNDTATLMLPLNGRYIMLFKHDPDSPHYLWLFYRKGGVPDIELVYECDNFYLFRNNLVKGSIISAKNNGSGNARELLRGEYSSNVTYESLGPSSLNVTSSEYPYIVVTSGNRDNLLFDGNQPFSWYGIGNGFIFSGPAVLEFHSMNLKIFLFLLAMLIAVLLLVFPSKAQLAGIAALFGLIYLGAITGHLGSGELGLFTLSILSSSLLFWCVFK
jgi:hypothetical protein